MHKRWFALVLMLTLIPGCSGRITETAPSEALYEAKPTDPVGFASLSNVPTADDTLQPGVLNIRDAVGFRFSGKDFLIFSGSEHTKLTLLDSQTLTVQAETVLPLTISPENPAVTVTADGVTYVDSATQELVFLDALLKDSRRISLPEGAAQAVLSSDQKLLYYCTAAGIQVLDVGTGIVRPVREMAFPHQEATALHCGDTVLQCCITDEKGTAHTLFVATDNGRLLYESTQQIPLWTDGTLYFAILMDGMYRELLSGSPDFGPSLLIPETEPVTVTPVLERKIVLLHTPSSDGGTVLDGYHLETGRRIIQLNLPQNHRVMDIQSDPQTERLWFLCHDTDTGTDYLFSRELFGVTDTVTYFQPRRSREDPDWDGLARCEELAKQLSRTHGVQIHIPTDTAEFSLGSYRLQPEYQVPLIKQMLTELDAALSRYPEGFLQELALSTDSGRLNICPVRSIYPEDSPNMALPNLSQRDEQRDIWLVFPLGPGFARQLDRMLCDLIVSRVLGVSDAYDSWDRRSATGSAHPERVQMLEAAMQADQATYFSSGFMQSSLRQLCLGIRETFRTAKDADSLFWEQHLS